jgi:hypothetical protein
MQRCSSIGLCFSSEEHANGNRNFIQIRRGEKEANAVSGILFKKNVCPEGTPTDPSHSLETTSS